MGLRHVFGDKPIPKLLDFMLVHRHWDYPISELENATGVSYRTLQNVIPKLVKNTILTETRTVGNAKFYSINVNSDSVKKLDAFAVQADLDFGVKSSAVKAKFPIPARS